MATPSATEELEALELARSRLEAALSGDENWRALRRSQTGGDGAADSASRRARNTRLEMALAGNAHFQAWTHLNGAIDALRARSAAQAQAAEPLVRPAQGGAAATRGSAAALPEDVEALLHGAAPGYASSDARPGPSRAEARPAPVAAAGPSSSAAPRLVDRLDRMEGPRDEGERRDQGRARPKERQAPPVAADPPEATVTFVVRETRAPMPSAELPAGLGTERGSALFERLRSLDEASAPTVATYAPAGAADEEAEVTILSVEALRQRRETDERVGIVRRFRKALSGD